MAPTNLTECLPWLDEAQAYYTRHPSNGSAYAAWLKAGSPNRFITFVASRVAECLRGHLAEKQQLNAVLKIQEDVQACAEKVDKITAKYAPAEAIKAPAPADPELMDARKTIRSQAAELKRWHEATGLNEPPQASPGTAPAQASPGSKGDHKPMTEEEKEANRVTARAQFRELFGPAKVTCVCGRCIPVRFAYKCLYCDIFHCMTCAEAHFGKTRAQYIAEKAAPSQAVAQEPPTAPAQGVRVDREIHVEHFGGSFSMQIFANGVRALDLPPGEYVFREVVEPPGAAPTTEKGGEG